MYIYIYIYKIEYIQCIYDLKSSSGQSCWRSSCPCSSSPRCLGSSCRACVPIVLDLPVPSTVPNLAWVRPALVSWLVWCVVLDCVLGLFSGLTSSLSLPPLCPALPPTLIQAPLLLLGGLALLFWAPRRRHWSFCWSAWSAHFCRRGSVQSCGLRAVCVNLLRSSRPLAEPFYWFLWVAVWGPCCISFHIWPLGLETRDQIAASFAPCPPRFFGFQRLPVWGFSVWSWSGGTCVDCRTVGACGSCLEDPFSEPDSAVGLAFQILPLWLVLIPWIVLWSSDLLRPTGSLENSTSVSWSFPRLDLLKTPSNFCPEVTHDGFGFSSRPFPKPLFFGGCRGGSGAIRAGMAVSPGRRWAIRGCGRRSFEERGWFSFSCVLTGFIPQGVLDRASAGQEAGPIEASMVAAVSGIIVEQGIRSPTGSQLEVLIVDVSADWVSQLRPMQDLDAFPSIRKIRAVSLCPMKLQGTGSRPQAKTLD